MKPEENQLLIECYRRTKSQKKTPLTWCRRNCDIVSRHGPKYDSGWFGDNLHPTLQKRFRRAIGSLESAGLLVTWKEWGIKISHVKLTPEGEKLAAEILAQEETTDVTT
jgi:hypothetical protein